MGRGVSNDRQWESHIRRLVDGEGGVIEVEPASSVSF